MRYRETLAFWPEHIKKEYSNHSALQLRQMFSISNLGPKHFEFWDERGWPDPELAQQEWLKKNTTSFDDIITYLRERALKDFEPTLFEAQLEWVDPTQTLSEINKNIKAQLNLPKCGRFTQDYWIARGWSLEVAQEMASRHKLDKTDKTPLTLQFWLDRGLSLEEAQEKAGQMRPTQIGYWMKQGLDHLSASLKVSEYQAQLAKKK